MHSFTFFSEIHWDVEMSSFRSCGCMTGIPATELTWSQWSRYKVPMKTLTITDAKKNLSRWLTAAAKGEDIGIVCGADIIALRKVEVEAIDYAQREYGATPEQVAALDDVTNGIAASSGPASS
jgi:antitoxin (DNA-binding transcriptional repressor) of toxin-antitoxin stability system